MRLLNLTDVQLDNAEKKKKEVNVRSMITQEAVVNSSFKKIPRQRECHKLEGASYNSGRLAINLSG